MFLFKLPRLPVTDFMPRRSLTKYPVQQFSWDGFHFEVASEIQDEQVEGVSHNLLVFLWAYIGIFLGLVVLPFLGKIANG